MTDTEMSQLRQNLMAQFQDMMEEEVIPESYQGAYESPRSAR
jgi:hypothetical protein